MQEIEISKWFLTFTQNAHGHAVRYPAHPEATFCSVLVCSQKATVKFQFLAKTLTSNQIHRY